jgi:hypothetical protein
MTYRQVLMTHWEILMAYTYRYTWDTDRWLWHVLRGSHDVYWQILMTYNDEHNDMRWEVHITYWKYSWHILWFTYDMLRRALDILTSNHDLYWQVPMTYTDRNSWHFMRGSRDLVTGNVAYAERFSWHTLHYLLIGSHEMLTDTHDIYWQVFILRRTHDIVRFSWHEALFIGSHLWTRPENFGFLNIQ